VNAGQLHMSSTKHALKEAGWLVLSDNGTLFALVQLLAGSTWRGPADAGAYSGSERVLELSSAESAKCFKEFDEHRLRKSSTNPCLTYADLTCAFQCQCSFTSCVLCIKAVQMYGAQRHVQPLVKEPFETCHLVTLAGPPFTHSSL